MDKKAREALRDTLMAKYLKQAFADIDGEPIEIWDLMENDFSYFASKKAKEIPQPRRKHLLRYTETAYIHGADDWNTITQMYLDDANRVLQLGTEVMKKLGKT